MFRFYYHPILGLQYEEYECQVILNLEMIPQHFDFADFKQKIVQLLSKQGVMLVDSASQIPAAVEELPTIIYNHSEAIWTGIVSMMKYFDKPLMFDEETFADAYPQ